MTGIVVLISGRGSNMRSLVEQGLPVRAVVSNRSAAAGLAYARGCELPAITVDPETYKVTADGVHLTCKPMDRLPLAQLYNLF